MSAHLRQLLLICCLISPLALLSQEAPQATQYGVRFNYQLVFPSENTIGLQRFDPVVTGHRLGFGAYMNIYSDPIVSFSPFLGVNHIFFPKGESYVNECDQDSFPTFFSLNDSLPGRDHRFWMVTFEPSLKFRINSIGISLRILATLNLSIRSEVENYGHSCGNTVPRSWLDFEDDQVRSHSKFTAGLGFSMIKEVMFSKGGGGMMIEVGYQKILNSLLRAREGTAEGLSLSLYPSGIFINLGFFR